MKESGIRNQESEERIRNQKSEERIREKEGRKEKEKGKFPYCLHYVLFPLSRSPTLLSAILV
jgi:hypothetical protein